MYTVPNGPELSDVCDYMIKLVKDRRAIHCVFDCDDPPLEIECIPVAYSSEGMDVIYLKDEPRFGLRKGEKVEVDFISFQHMQYEYIEVTDPEFQQYLCTK